MCRKKGISKETIRHLNFDECLEKNYNFLIEQSKKLGKKLHKNPDDLLGSFILKLNKSLWTYKPENSKNTKFSTYFSMHMIGYLVRDFFSKDSESETLHKYSRTTNKQNRKNLSVRYITNEDSPIKESNDLENSWIEEFSQYFPNRIKFWKNLSINLNENERIILFEYIKGTKLENIAKKIKKNKSTVCIILRDIKVKMREFISNSPKLTKIKDALQYV